MFNIKDFVSPRQFIAKLNKLFSFDGKYSSLTDIPNSFPPEEHTHTIVSETGPGFISKSDYDHFCNTYTPTPFIHSELGYAWKGDSNYTPINVNGYAALYCNKLGYNIKQWSTRELNRSLGPYVSLFNHNIIYLTPEFTMGSGDHSHLSGTDSFVLNLYLELTDIQRYLLQLGKQLDRYLSSLNELPYIDIPLSIVFQYLGEWNGVVSLGKLIINNFRDDEDYCNTTTYPSGIGNDDFLNNNPDIVSFDEHLWSDVSNGNFSNLFFGHYFGNTSFLQMFAMNKYCLKFQNQDFYIKQGGLQNKTLIEQEPTGNPDCFRSICINGFLRLSPNKDPNLEGCLFFSL